MSDSVLFGMCAQRGPAEQPLHQGQREQEQGRPRGHGAPQEHHVPTAASAGRLEKESGRGGEGGKGESTDNMILFRNVSLLPLLPPFCEVE